MNATIDMYCVFYFTPAVQEDSGIIVFALKRRRCAINERVTTALGSLVFLVSYAVTAINSS